MDHLLRDQAIFRVAATLFFVLFFAGMSLWLLRGGRERFRHDSELPLQDGFTADPDTASADDRGGHDHD